MIISQIQPDEGLIERFNFRWFYSLGDLQNIPLHNIHVVGTFSPGTAHSKVQGHKLKHEKKKK